MIRVLVVEDEPPIMRVIVKLIESIDKEFKVIATAINGKKALEQLEREPVDVIFSDVKMPIMGGIELAKWVSEQRPEVMVVMISGFKDFEYAREALRFGVYDYLLKPIVEEDMRQVIKRIQEAYTKNKRIEERQCIIQLINEETIEKEWTQSLEHKHAVFLVCAGAFPLAPADPMLPARAFWNSFDLKEWMRSRVYEEENSMCFRGKSTAEMVIMVEVREVSRIVELAGQIIEALQIQTTLPITLVSSEKGIALSEVGEVLKKLRQKLYNEIKLFQSHRVWLDETVQLEREEINMKELFKEIEQAIHKGEDSVRDYCQRVLEEWRDKGRTQIQVTQFLEVIVHHYYLENYTVGHQSPLFQMDINNAMCNASSPKDLAEDITFMLGLRGKSEEKEGTPEVINQIEDYLKQHYNQPITTTILSKKFGFVPSYMSKLFRSYKGMSPSEYLTYYRIKKAKEIMKEQPKLLFKEVASLVGFSDPYYFSKTFKKETGLRPTEFVGRE